jgi:hypothetical protein
MDIIASRQCSVGPGGHFMPGPDQGPVTISVNFYRPVMDPEQGPGLYPSWQCAYEIKHGDEMVHASVAAGIDGVAALLAAMRHAVIDLEHRYLEEWRVSIPKGYLADMRDAG